MALNTLLADDILLLLLPLVGGVGTAGKSPSRLLVRFMVEKAGRSLPPFPGVRLNLPGDWNTGCWATMWGALWSSGVSSSC